MAKRSTLRQRLEIIMQAEGWKKAELSRKAGCSRQAVTNWFNGPVVAYEMDARYAWNLADNSKSHFNPRWIALGEGPERLVPVSKQDQDLLATIRDLPPLRREALAVFLKT
jgi:transcriptional regulator with XRE-family HTH domain